MEGSANCSINIPRPHKKYVTPKRDPFAYFPQEMEPKISLCRPLGFECQGWLCNRISQSSCSIANKLCAVAVLLLNCRVWKAPVAADFHLPLAFYQMDMQSYIYIYMYRYVVGKWGNRATCHENCVHWLHWFMAQMLLHAACCALYGHFDWLFASAQKAA